MCIILVSWAFKVALSLFADKLLISRFESYFAFLSMHKERLQLIPFSPMNGLNMFSTRHQCF
jgi:hypothetical protein